MRPKVWRYRQCPHCKATLPASDFENHTLGANWNDQGWAERSCPECGYNDDTRRFRLVAQYRKPPEYVPQPYKQNPLLPPPSETNPLLPRTTERPPVMALFDAYLGETWDMEEDFEAFCTAMGWEVHKTEANIMVATNEGKPTVVMSRFGVPKQRV